MSHPPQKSSLTLPATFESGSAAADWLLGIAAAHGIEGEAVDRIVLATAEAIANAAEHGSGSERPGTVDVSFQVSQTEILVCVEDETPGVGIDRIDEAALPEDPLSEGGRGLFIIREVTDRVWLEQEGRRLCLAWERS